MKKALIIGLGSMGKRRVRNLLANGFVAEEIIGLDTRADRTAEAAEKYGIIVHRSIDDVDLTEIGVCVVSVPPDLHEHYARLAIDAGKHTFIEASVLDEGLARLADDANRKGVVIFPSCTMRYCAGPQRISRLIRDGVVGKVLAWQYQSGQYLPDWHPWEDIGEFYVSKRETGGCREIVPFEMAWLVPLFGPLRNVEGRKAKRSDMLADIDDIYMLQMEHEDGTLGQLLVDVLSRTAVRAMRITGSAGTLEWDEGERRIRIFRAGEQSWHVEYYEQGTLEKGYINPEEPYISEIGDFIAAVQSGRHPDYSLRDDIATLAILYAAECSDDDRQRVDFSTAT